MYIVLLLFWLLPLKDAGRTTPHRRSPSLRIKLKTADLKDRTNRRNPKPIVSTVVVKPELVFPLFYFQALDLTLAKDERLAVGFFQRSAVTMQLDRHKAAQTKVPLFYDFTMKCFYLRQYIFVFLSLQTGGSSVRLYLGTEAHARKRSHRLQTAGASIQTE